MSLSLRFFLCEMGIFILGKVVRTQGSMKHKEQGSRMNSMSGTCWDQRDKDTKCPTGVV